MQLVASIFQTRAFLLAVLILLFPACGSLKTRSPVAAQEAYTPELEEQSKVLSYSNTPPMAKVEKRLKIPVELNPAVEKWIDFFTNKDRERFQRFLNRGQQYREVVESVLEESDLPAELYYLAMIESGYRTHAKSHAKAVGVWQFIAGTGTRYGLRINSYIDERRDPIRATEAAAKYLRDLYNVFGSWHLAMAAYNAGEIRVLRAIMKGRTRSFWELVQLRALPSETANYVPKFLAVVMIGQNPEKYGFKVTSDGVNYPNLETANVPGFVSLQSLAVKSGIPLSTLKTVNPHLLRSMTPPTSTGYEVWVPEGMTNKVAAVRTALLSTAKRQPAIALILDTNTNQTFHIVRRGENLSSIAHKYNISIGHLMRINNMKSSRIYAGAKLRTQVDSYKASSTVRYKVRRGDNLTVIARRFRTTPERIKVKNNLSRNRIFVGQLLKIVRGN